MFSCASAFILRRPIHIGKVIYWSTPHSSRLNTVCSACCHATTYTAGEDLPRGRIREINSEPSTKGATDKTIIIVGLSRWQAMMACSAVKQHTMRAAAVPSIAAMRLAVALRSEYITIVW